jgi:hypothetical protein
MVSAPPPRDRLAELLAGVTTPGTFSARRAASTDDLHLEVLGVGGLALPVPDDQAGELCRIGRPARYGRGEAAQESALDELLAHRSDTNQTDAHPSTPRSRSTTATATTGPVT